MQGGVKKKKVEPTTPLRSVLGEYNPLVPSVPLGLDQPVNLSTMIGSVPPVVPKDTGKKIKLPSDSVKSTLTTPPKEDIKPKDIKNVTKQVTQAIVEKKAVEDPSWYERNKKGLRDAGIIIAGGLASFGEGIKGGSQTAANEKIYQNLDAASKADEMELLEDPNSEQSKQARDLFNQIYKGRVKMPENMTAAQFTKMSPVFDKIFQVNRPMMPKAKELGKPIIDAKQVERLDNARRLKTTTNELATELESSSGLGRMFGFSPETDRNRLADDITSYKAVLQGQGQAGEGQIKAGRENYAAPSLLEKSSDKAKKIREEGEKFYKDEIQKLLRQGFQAKTLNGRQYLVNADTGEFLEM